MVRPAKTARFLSSYDVRLRRELVYRRQLVALVRRLLRVVSLHAIDGALLASAVWFLTREGWRFEAARPYAISIVLIFLLSLDALSAYRSGDARRDDRRLLLGVCLALLILGCMASFAPYLPFSLYFLLSLGALGFALLSAGRKLTDQVVRQVYRRGIGLRRALLIGNLDEVGKAIEELRDDRYIDQYLVGHLAPEADRDPTALASVYQLPQVLDEMDVQEVILATSLPAAALEEVADCCFRRGVALYMFPSLLGSIHCRAEPFQVGRCPLLHLSPRRIEVPTFFLKRTFDLVLAAILLVLCAPLLAAIALAIRTDSRGPVFFRQERVGVGGRHFIMWKFRSMHANADEAKQDLAHLNAYGDSRLFKMPSDPRVTRVGRLLRRTSLDELPQLFNVLLGDMSLVGPRPPVPSEVASYEPHHFDRLSVLPGITGPWQVGGRNLITDFEEVVRMERAYIQSWSLMVDVRILFQTIGAVVSGRGAY